MSNTGIVPVELYKPLITLGSFSLLHDTSKKIVELEHNFAGGEGSAELFAAAGLPISNWYSNLRMEEAGRSRHVNQYDVLRDLFEFGYSQGIHFFEFRKAQVSEMTQCLLNVQGMPRLACTSDWREYMKIPLTAELPLNIRDIQAIGCVGLALDDTRRYGKAFRVAADTGKMPELVGLR